MRVDVLARKDNETKKMGMSIQTPESAKSRRDTFVPVSKGDVITVYCYSVTVTQFRFIYAEGESYNPVSSSGAEEGGQIPGWGDGGVD